MPHDKNGLLVGTGDEVLIRARVVDVFPNEGYCNVSLETIEPMFPGTYPVGITLNTRQVERAPSQIWLRHIVRRISLFTRE